MSKCSDPPSGSTIWIHRLDRLCSKSGSHPQLKGQINVETVVSNVVRIDYDRYLKGHLLKTAKLFHRRTVVHVDNAFQGEFGEMRCLLGERHLDRRLLIEVGEAHLVLTHFEPTGFIGCFFFWLGRKKSLVVYFNKKQVHKEERT